MKDQLLDWYENESDKGMSSRAMANAMSETAVSKCRSHPIDPSDFNRCLLFLKRVPDARNNFSKIAELSRTWKRIIDNFSELEQIFLEEVGLDWEKGHDLKAEKTYNYMRNVLLT